MPPQVGRAGDGPGPFVSNTGGGVEEVQSHEVEKKSTEQNKDTPKNEGIVPRRATAKEASDKKRDVNVTGDAQRTALNNKLNEIKGTSGNDNIHISKASGLNGLLGLYEVDVNGSKQYMTKQQLERSIIKAGAGNDTVVVDSNVNADITVDGGSGNDVIIGGRGNDKLDGGDGNDVIFGRDGKDKISGGRGKDRIFGGVGDDVIDGGDGNDRIHGGRGNDRIKGGKGSDLIEGGAGFDFIVDERKRSDQK